MEGHMSATPRNIRERTFEFGVRIVRLADRLPRTIASMKIGQQVIEPEIVIRHSPIRHS
jgi:hypothetical protein